MIVVYALEPSFSKLVTKAGAAPTAHLIAELQKIGIEPVHVYGLTSVCLSLSGIDWSLVKFAYLLSL